MKVLLSEKGQVTIPKLLRDQLGLRPGQMLEFSNENGRLVATKAALVDSVDGVYGILLPRRSTNAYLDEIRGEPDATDPH